MFVSYKWNNISLLLQLGCNILITESETSFFCVLWRSQLWTGILPQAPLHFRTLTGDKPIYILTNSFEILGEKSVIVELLISVASKYQLRVAREVQRVSKRKSERVAMAIAPWACSSALISSGRLVWYQKVTIRFVVLELNTIWRSFFFYGSTEELSFA